LYEAYRAMDVFAFASKSETQGMVLAEAMAATLPVVALNASGVREVMRDGKNGFMLPAAAKAARFAEQLGKLREGATLRRAFRREAIAHPLDGTGFIVPEPEQLGGVRAVTFSSSKLPQRAPADRALLRLFYRPSEHDLRSLSDGAWAERAERALGRALPLHGSAEQAVVSRWSNALPVFDPAHRARVAALEAALVGRHIWLAGAAFHGSGIDAAIRSAEAASVAISSRA